MPTHKEYVAQIRQMSHNAKRWRAAHPDVHALVQFNVPPRVLMIAPVSLAVAQKIITTNDAGLELLKFLWPWDTRSEPTVTMVRIALEVERF